MHVFSQILMRKCLPLLNCGFDCVFLNTSSFNVISKAWNTAFRWLLIQSLEDWLHQIIIFKIWYYVSKIFIRLEIDVFCKASFMFFKSAIKKFMFYSMCGTSRRNGVNVIFRRYNLIMFSRVDSIRAAVFD